MKLLIITAVEAFTGDMRTLLGEADIKNYSCCGVTGYHHGGEEDSELNWFGSEPKGTGSVLCYAITTEGNVGRFLEAVKTFNAGGQQSRIHVACVAMENTCR